MKNGDKFQQTGLRYLIWLIAAVSLFLFSLVQPFRISGDGLEYLIQTQSILFDRSLSINKANRAKYWNETNPFNSTLSDLDNNFKTKFQISERSQSGGGFGSLYPDRNGEYFYVHSWMYSLLSSPIYQTLSVVSPLLNRIGLGPEYLEYRAFQIFNSLLLAGALIIGVQNLFGLAVALLLLFSPLGGYLSWSTPELFQFSVIAIAFTESINQRKFLPPLLVGLAGAQNFPALIFLIPLILFQLSLANHETHLNPRAVVTEVFDRLPAYMLAFGVGLLPWIMFFLKFGTPNLIVSLGQASISNCTLDRLKSFLFSPLMGVFWFFPLYFFLYPLLLFQSTHCSIQRRLAHISLIACVLLLSFAMTGMANFHSQQLGCARYAVWIFAPFAGLLLSASVSLQDFIKKYFVFGILLSSLVVYFYRNHLFLIANHPRTNYLGVFPNQAKKIYRILDFKDDPEVLVEQLMQHEISAPWQFDANYEIPLGENQSLCLMSLRSKLHGKNEYLPQGKLCKGVDAPDTNSKFWLRSPVLGNYYVEKVTKP